MGTAKYTPENLWIRDGKLIFQEMKESLAQGAKMLQASGLKKTV